jgi:hypothetical protein
MKTTSFGIAMLLAMLTSLPLSYVYSNNSSFSLHCPGNVWVTCEDEIWDLSIYGNAYYHDYDGDHDAGDPVVNYNLNMCDVGTITRTWTVTNPYTNYPVSCTQTIYVSSAQEFTENDITWPQSDLVLEGCNPNTDPSALPYGYQYPTFNNVGCSMVGHSYKDKVFVFSSSCKKIVRTWKVVDWCTWNPNSGSDQGIWYYYQSIDISNNEQPDITCPADITVNSYNCVSAYVDLDSIMIGGDNCDGQFWVFNTSPYADDDGPDASGHYPIGTTSFMFKVKYGCNYWENCTVNITVEDVKAPVPYCIYGLSVPLMPVYEEGNPVPVDGMIEIWASDFDKGSYHTCDNGPIEFSFSSDINDKSKMFTCEDVGRNDVEIWVTDKLGNQNFCSTYIKIQNNGANIPDCEEEVEMTRANISGSIADLEREMKGGLDVNLQGNYFDTTFVEIVDTTIVIEYDSFVNQSGALIVRESRDTFYDIYTEMVVEKFNLGVLSDQEGYFVFEDLPLNQSYDVNVTMEQDHLKGLNHKDAEALLNYILKKEKLKSPYLILAADVNDSRTVDLEDLTALLAVITGQESELPTSNIWLCVERDIIFDDFHNPFPVLDNNRMAFSDLEDFEHVDVYAIKKGDLVFNTKEDPLEREKTGSDKKIQEFLSYAAEHVSHKELVKIKYLELRESFGGIAKMENVTTAPNPFVDETTIQFELELQADVQLIITDQRGSRIFSQNRQFNGGVNSWNIKELSDYSNGVYFYQLQSGETLHAGKLIKLK